MEQIATLQLTFGDSVYEESMFEFVDGMNKHFLLSDIRFDLEPLPAGVGSAEYSLTVHSSQMPKAPESKQHWSLSDISGSFEGTTSAIDAVSYFIEAARDYFAPAWRKRSNYQSL